jgi:hypothetical protein
METREPAMKQKYNACRNAVKNESRRREHQEQLANVKQFKEVLELHQIQNQTAQAIRLSEPA